MSSEADKHSHRATAKDSERTSAGAGRFGAHKGVSKMSQMMAKAAAKGARPAAHGHSRHK